MTVYVIVKKDATGLHICRIYLNVLSAEAQKREYQTVCAYDATFEVIKFDLF